ncbi:hypothetical protein A2U01_0109438, partial [Trifolium medium]|nr:hypothetical protein [Trifolium medium]
MPRTVHLKRDPIV